MRVRALFAVAAVVVPAGFAGGAFAVGQQQRFDAAFPDVDPSIADGSAQRALDKARARWRKTGPRSYTYRARISCFCTPESTKPHTFVVRNRKPRHPPKGFEDLATASRLFKLVQQAIDERVDGLDVRYAKQGILKQLSVDRYSNAADDESTYFVDRFSSP
jgi:hypothetical protein